jgi:uncharacterized protein YjgD (DUF1641 family)
MDTKEEIRLLHEKIDFLTEQVVGVTSRLKAVDELKEDLALFASDAFSEVIRFLAEVDFHFRSDDFVALLKKLFRNVNNLNRMMGQLESVVELVEDVRPLAKDIFNELVDKLDGMEREGVLESLRSLGRMMGTLQQNFTPEEIEDLGDQLARMVKIAIPPPPGHMEMLADLRKTIQSYEYKKDEKVTVLKVLKKLRSPETLRNLNMILDIVASISIDSDIKQDKQTQKEEV